MAKMFKWVGSMILGLMTFAGLMFGVATTASAATLPQFNPKGLVPASIRIVTEKTVFLNSNTQTVVVTGQSKNSAGYAQGSFFIFTYNAKTHKFVNQYTGTGAETSYSVMTGKLFNDSRTGVVIVSKQANWGRAVVGAQIFGLSYPTATTVKRFETTTSEVNATYQISNEQLIQTFSGIKHSYTYNKGQFMVQDETSKPKVSANDAVVYYSVSADGNSVTLSQDSITVKVGQTIDFIRQDNNSAPSAVLLSMAPQSSSLKPLFDDTENVQFVASQEGEVDLQIAPNFNLDNSPVFSVTITN